MKHYFKVNNSFYASIFIHIHVVVMYVCERKSLKTSFSSIGFTLLLVTVVKHLKMVKNNTEKSSFFSRAFFSRAV